MCRSYFTKSISFLGRVQVDLWGQAPPDSAPLPPPPKIYPIRMAGAVLDLFSLAHTALLRNTAERRIFASNVY